MPSTIEFAKAACTVWAKSMRNHGGGVNLGYPTQCQEYRWIREGILPPTKHKKFEDSYEEALADTVCLLIQKMDPRARKAIEAHYLHARRVAEWRYRRAGMSKSSYYRALDIGHDFLARNL